jgi:hypothetical protein
MLELECNTANSSWWMRVQLLLNLAESWNGTNWTEVNDLNTARRSEGMQEQQHLL